MYLLKVNDAYSGKIQVTDSEIH